MKKTVMKNYVVVTHQRAGWLHMHLADALRVVSRLCQRTRQCDRITPFRIRVISRKSMA